MASAAQWKFLDDSGKFAPFEAKFAAFVENVYKVHNGTGTWPIIYEGWKYEFNFDAMTQKNLDSGKVRKTERTAPKLSPPEWEWKNDKGGWSAFDAAATAQLELHYHSVSDSSPNFELTLGSWAYTIDFSSMTQLNKSSGKVRPIQRKANGHPTRAFAAPAADEPAVKKLKTETGAVPVSTFSAPPLAVATPAVAPVHLPVPKSAEKSLGHGGTTKLIKKGKGVVDEYSGMVDTCHVYEASNVVYQCMLNQTNLDQNNNKYYVIQLLEEDKGGKFYVFTRWARVGVKPGQSALDVYTSVAPAIMQYKKKFREKTGNDWSMGADSFVKIPGKYQLMAIDLGDDDKDTSILDALASAGDSGAIAASKLSHEVQGLMRMIANKAEMTASMKELEINTDKMPLGKISKKQIKEAFGYLKDIETELKKHSPSHSVLMNASSMFYTLIPHDYGMAVPPVIKTSEHLKRKMELLDILGDLEIATTLLSTAKKSGVNPLDQAYDSLNCQLTPLSHSSAEFLRVQEYVRNTHGKTHTAFKLAVENVFEVRREIEQLRYKAYEPLNPKMMLWHGSRTTNFMGILSQGLRIAPPEAPVTGYMFGKGIYFADVASKSANYCATTTTNNKGLLLLCEVALGTTKDLTAAMYMDKSVAGTHSTKGLGKMCPDPAKSVTVDGVTWPLGPMTDAPGVGHTSLLYPEYIVYDVAQCRMKYLVQLRFDYGKK